MPVYSITDVTPGDTTSHVFDLSDDGRVVAYVAGTVRVIDLTTGVMVDTGVGGTIHSLTLSPDGSKLAATVLPAGASQTVLYLVDVASNTATSLAQSVGQPYRGFIQYPTKYTAPDFSSDGKLLIFDSGQGNLVTNDTNNQSDVFSYNLVTGQFELLSRLPDGNQYAAEDGSISADGTKLAYIVGSDIWVKDLTNGSAVLAVQGSVFNFYANPQFSPDGTKVYYEIYLAGSMNPVRGGAVKDLVTGLTSSLSGLDLDLSADGLKMASGDGKGGLVFFDDGTTTEQVNAPLSNPLYGTIGYNPQISPGGEFVFYSGTARMFIAGGGLNSVIMVRVAPVPLGQDIAGTPGDDPSLAGTEGDDSIDGLAGADTMDGRGGADTYYLDNPGDVIVEALSSDVDQAFTTVSYTLGAGSDVEALIARDRGATTPLDLTSNELGNNLLGNNGVNVLRGEGGDDWLFGYVGNDLLYGGTQGDYLIGGPGADLLYGGAGDDIYILEDSLDTVFELVGEGFDVVYVYFNYALAESQEIEMLSTGGEAAGTAALVLAGNGYDNLLYANAGANVLFGGAGADSLFGLEGGDALFGGDGKDRIYGGTGNDALVGEAGDDLLEGNEGNDLLDGGLGADTLAGSAGNDSYIVDNAADVIVEGASQGTLDSVYALVSYTLAAGAYVEQLVAGGSDPFAAIDLTGSDLANNVVGNEADNLLRGAGGNDSLFGNGGIDRLEGGAGADTFSGGAGADTLVGGLGDDLYIVDAADILVEVAGEGFDVVYANFSYALPEGLDVEVLSTGADRSGTSAIDFTGNGIGNRLEGNAGINVLSGGGGNDALWSYQGADTLTGGAGADQFFFSTAPTTADTITDFATGVDKLMLSRFQFGSPPTGNPAANTLAIGTAAIDTDDRFIYDPTSGRLWFDSDGTGAAAAQQLAQLQPALDLTVIDLVFY